MTSPNPLHAAAPGAGPVVYYSGRVFLAMISTLGRKLGLNEDSNIRTKKNLRTRVRLRIGRFERRLSSKDYNACLQGLEKKTYRHQSCDIGLVFLCQHH